MGKLIIVFALLVSLNSFSQTILEVASFPIYDSMGIPTYIKKSDVNDYNNPKTGIKIFNYDEKLDTIGYWVDIKKK